MLIRQAWDGQKLENRRRESEDVAADHHLGFLAHITPEELLARLTENELSNGFANRFLYVASKRSKMLPFGGNVEGAVVGGFAKRLRHATEWAHQSRILGFTRDAAECWDGIYRAEPDRAGLVGKLTARAHPQKLRLAVCYAILDEADAIGAAHVRAAEALWRYSVATVEHIFGNLRGDSVQDRLLSALQQAYPAGMTTTEQSSLFNRNLQAGRLSSARTVLEHDGFIRTVRGESGEKGGRPESISYAIPPLERTKKHEETYPLDSALGLIRVNSCSPESGDTDEPLTGSDEDLL
jgi:hypothetical protein